jgi:DNA-binding transcriptional ArsR family regulator
VTEIQEILPAPQVNISQHLSLLRHAGIVSFARNGSRRCYYVSRPRMVSTILHLLKKGEPFINKTHDDIKREQHREARHK